MVRRIVAIAILLLVANVGVAQVGGLEVSVRDSESRPLPGATVTISHELGYVKTTSEQTNRDGRARFPVLRPGSGYAVQITSPGFSPLRYNDVRVRLNEQYALVVDMIEEMTEQVRVTADRGVVDLDKSESSTKFSDDFMADLPVLDRFYQNILVMAPGVQDADGDGNPNVHGSRNRDFQAIVSGVSNVDPLTGRYLSQINFNSIEEIEVITAGAGVEYGRAQGGFARIIQKQGSNSHEGIVEYYWQTSKLDGGSVDYDTFLPGFQFSGPILRDRMWYRVSWENRDREEPVNVVSGVEVYTNDSETRDAQLTFQASPRNKLTLQYRSDPFSETNFGISSRVPVEASQSRERDVDTYSLTWTAPYSPKILVESTVAWQEIVLRTAPTVSGVINECVPNSNQPFLPTSSCLNLDTDRLSGSFTDTVADFRQRFTFKSRATIYAGRVWGADHQFKLGFNVENERYARDLRRTPDITFEIVPPMGFSPAFGVVNSRIDVPDKDRVRATGTNWALYAEDQIKPTANLTITVGARFDREELNSEGRERIDYAAELAAYEQTVPLELIGLVPLEDIPGGGSGPWPLLFTGYEDFGAFEDQLVEILCAGLPAIAIGNCKTTSGQEIQNQSQDDLFSKRLAQGLNITNNNVSPFLSLAWSPWSNGKTAIKASAGRHYNNIPLIVPLQELEPVTTSVEYRAELDTFQTTISSAIRPTVTVRTVDPELATPYQDEFTFSLERELWAESSFRLTYISRKFRDQLQDQNVNVRPGDYGACGPAIGVNVDVLPSPGLGPNDTDPGLGDGTLDDCAGDSIRVGGTDVFGTDSVVVRIPDGFPDLYVQNPFWGGVFEVGNINEIDYEAVVLELIRRQYRSWEMNASYTWSEAKGNGEDFFQELGNDPSLRTDIEGFQSYDQRHVVKLNATTITPWGFRLGTAVTWQSGLPYSIIFQDTSVDLLTPSTAIFTVPGSQPRQSYPTGVRNDQRNDSYWNVDIQATKELRLGSRVNLQVSAEVFNVLNDETLQIYNPFFEAGQQVNGVNEAQRRRGRHWQVGMKVSF